jgi:hypothetical protein
MALRLAATAALVGLYYRIDWGWLAHATARAVAVALRLLGHSVALVADDGGPALIVAPPERGLQAFLVTANCTYADLVLAAAPFCWATGLGLRRNVARLGLLTAAVAALNLARLTWAVSAFAQGVAWRWAHQAPDLIAHGGVLALVLFDLARRSPPPAAATVG